MTELAKACSTQPPCPSIPTLVQKLDEIRQYRGKDLLGHAGTVIPDQSKNRLRPSRCLCPGFARRSSDQTSRFELLDKAKAKAPSRSLVRIDDVGIAIAFLAHDAARLVTGETSSTSSPRERHVRASPSEQPTSNICVFSRSEGAGSATTREELGALRRLDDQARTLERHATGPGVDELIAEERRRSHSYGGRSMFGWEQPPASGPRTDAMVRAVSKPQ